MACRSCTKSQPRTPFVRQNMPTVFAWGPFPNHVALDVEQGLRFAEEAASKD